MRILLYLSLLVGSSHGFFSVVPFAQKQLNVARASSLLFLGSDERVAWEKQREEAKATLKELDEIEAMIRQRDGDVEQVISQVENAIQNVEKINFSTLIPPPGVSLEEYEAAIRQFANFPVSIQMAFCKALGLDEKTSLKVTEYPEIVSRIRKESARLTPKRLTDAMKDTKKRLKSSSQASRSNTVGDSLNIDDQKLTEMRDLLMKDFEMKDSEVNDIFGVLDTPLDQLSTEIELEKNLPRVILNKEGGVTKKELDILMSAIQKGALFNVFDEPRAISGGYIIRGRNTKSTGKEFVQELEKNLPKEFPATVSLMKEFILDENEEEGDIKKSVPDNEDMLLLVRKEFDTNGGLVAVLSFLVAMTSTFIVGAESYNGNDSVTQVLNDALALDNFSGLDWFNLKLLEIFLPLFFIQGTHELGHFLVAKRDKFETTTSTLLPMVILPNLGFKTGIKTAPKDLTSLFDFAFLGPFMGIFTSLVFLVLGAKLTTGASPEALQLFPSLPVSTIRFSTLGGALLDYFFGGNGAVTGQNPSYNFLLHPFAIAGYFGLMINSLELLPIGGSDGGRIAQALFQRKAQSSFTNLFWLGLLIFSFFPGADVLTAAWIVTNAANGDKVEPCKNEIDSVNFVRYGLAFAIWLVAFLSIFPITN